MNAHSQSEHSAPNGRLFIIFGPLLVLGALTAFIAVGAGLFGWYQGEMLTIATAMCGILLAVSVILLYRGMSQRNVARQMLQSAEARVGGIVESAMDAIIAVDENQKIVLFNAAAEKVFGHRRDDAQGQSLDMLLPARFRASHRGHIENFGRAGTTSRRMGEQLILWGKRQNGEEFPIEASISLHREGEHRIHTVILRDITSRIRADEALRCSREELRERYRAAEVFVFPSYFEGFGLVLLEAMACGLPAIASEATAGPDVLDAACGAVVQTGNLEALVESLRSIARRRAEVAAMGLAARAQAARCSWDNYRRCVTAAVAPFI